MLGFVSFEGDVPGAADRLISQTAQKLRDEGLRLAGAVQVNIDHGPDRDCDMELEILGDDGPMVRISQSLGSCSQGCRLDTDALSRAAGRVDAVLEQGADLLIVNKFGKNECKGGGFRQAIARALAEGIPVLVYVPPQLLADFHSFAGDLAEAVAPNAIGEWCLSARADQPA